MTRQNLDTLKTDEERLLHLHETSYVDWDLVALWESEAENEENRRVFHNRAVSLYHQDEYHCYGEL